MNEAIMELKKLVDGSDNIVFFGGAGVSTESGIKDFRSVKAAVGFEALVDTQCDAYEDLGLQYVPPQAVDACIADCPAVFNAPIVRNGKQATVGYHPEIWETWK